MTPTADILIGDVRAKLAELPAGSVHCCVTSPPYWGLRDYGVAGQIGSEATPAEFVAVMVGVFREVWRVLRDDGVLFCNLGDTYFSTGVCGGSSPVGDREARATDAERQSGMARGPVAGLKPKDLCGMPWRVALALQADGWYLRQDIIWHKPSPMPESVTDRCTKAHEYIFLLTKRPRYYFDALAIAEPAINAGRVVEYDGEQKNCEAANDPLMRTRTASTVTVAETRNARSVWTIASQGYAEAHFATFPEKLAERCILAGTSAHGCCAACGAPWRRIVEREKRTRERPNELTKRTGEPGTGNHCANTVSGVNVTTKGWEPGCACAAEVVSCRVLEPFLGSGTTLAVALRHGRSGVGIELNPAYAELARKRIAKARETAPLFLATQHELELE